MWKIHGVFVETGNPRESTTVTDDCRVVLIDQVVVFVTLVRKRFRFWSEKEDIIFLDISAAYTQNVHDEEIMSQVRISPKSARKIRRYIRHLDLEDDDVNHLIEKSIPFAIEFRLLDIHPS